MAFQKPLLKLVQQYLYINLNAVWFIFHNPVSPSIPVRSEKTEKNVRLPPGGTALNSQSQSWCWHWPQIIKLWLRAAKLIGETIKLSADSHVVSDVEPAVTWRLSIIGEEKTKESFCGCRRLINNVCLICPLALTRRLDCVFKACEQKGSLHFSSVAWTTAGVNSSRRASNSCNLLC